MIPALLAAFSATSLAALLVLDHVHMNVRRLRRRLLIADQRTNRYLEDLCWTYVRDDAYRAAITLTLARYGAVSAADLVPVLERARLLDDAPRLEVVR